MICSFRDRVASEIKQKEVKETSEKKQVKFANAFHEAITQLNEGLPDYWIMLATKLQQDMLKSSELLDLLKQAESCLHLLTKKHEDVVDVLLRLNYECREIEVIVQSLKLYTNIVATNSIHVLPVVRKLFKKLLPSFGTIIVEQERIHELTKQTIVDILSFIPQLLNEFPKLIFSHLPNEEVHIDIHVAFLKNLQDLTKMRSDLRPLVMEAMMRQILDMDVNASKEDAHLLNQEEEEENEQNPIVQKSLERKKMWLEKVDNLMNLMIEYLKEEIYDDKKNLRSVQANILYTEILSIFETVTLPVSNPNYVQFVTFYFMSSKVNFCDKFIDHLWQKVKSYQTSQSLCQTIMAYIGSFIARAKKVPLSTVTAFLSCIVPWLHDYIDEKERSDVDLSRPVMFGKFYSICQTLLYIIVFRNRQLLDNPKGYTYMEGLKLGRIITCSLNPLRYCQPTVVQLFSKIMRDHQLIYCHTIIEQNRRNFLPFSEECTKPNPFDSFFPFEPIKLPLSSKHIDDIYQPWEGMLPIQATNDDGDSSEDEMITELLNA